MIPSLVLLLSLGKVLVPRTTWPAPEDLEHLTLPGPGENTGFTVSGPAGPGALLTIRRAKAKRSGAS